MTLTLSLSPDLEKRLTEEAARNGTAVDQLALSILDAGLSESQRRQQAVALLQSWIDDKDDEDQRETGEYLIRVLDEDRLSDRPLFPPELKGITW